MFTCSRNCQILRTLNAGAQDYAVPADAHPVDNIKRPSSRSLGSSEHMGEPWLPLRRHAEEHAVVAIEETQFGMRYTIDGQLSRPMDVRPTCESLGLFVGTKLRLHW